MKNVIGLIIILIIGWSCAEEPVETINFELDTTQGVFIACEGNFMYGNGALSFYHTGNKEISNQVYYARNNVPLGDVVQSLARFEDQLFIVVNNSGKIIVADAKTVEHKGSITGLTSPRYIHFISDNKAYISDLHSNVLNIFDSETLTVTGTVDLGGHTSERMVQIGNFLYISHWSYGKTILVVDITTDEMVAEIEVPLQPKDLVVDSNNMLWILSDGGYEGSPSGDEVPAISRIDPETQTIEQIYRFQPGDVPSNLTSNRNGDTIYFLNRHVYKMHIESRHLPDTAFIEGDDELFYHLASDPVTDEIYIANAIDYTQDAIIYRYSQDGKLIDQFKSGINPSYFSFR